MAKFLNLLGGVGKDNKEVLATLQALDMRRSPVRMEIENSAIHFNTRISVKSSTVVVAKPLNLREGLAKGGTVRFRVPGGDQRELRLEVLQPHFNLTNGNPVFLCKIPHAFAQTNKRASLRFNTSRFSNVALVLSGHPTRYRVVDLSMGGCKVYISGKEDKERFSLGVAVQGARIDLGNKASVHLSQVVARNFHGQAVGCQFQVTDQGPSRNYLSHLLKTLEREELERYRT